MSGRRLALTPEGVELAYRHGIFPMADEGSDEVLWFRPDPRAIVPLDGFHVSRSLARTIRRGRFEVRSTPGAGTRIVAAVPLTEFSTGKSIGVSNER